MGEEDDRQDTESADIKSKDFWNTIEDSLTLAMELLQEMAKEQGINLNNIDVEETTREQ